MKSKTMNCNGKLVSFEKPLIAGILNVTPDSFYDGNKYINREAILTRCKKMINEGADFIDIGAVSSRPGAEIPTVKVEKERLLPALEIIREQYPDLIISIDTFRHEVALEAANRFKIDIVNDISAGDFDPELPILAGEKKLPYIIMHMQGMPSNMQRNPKYSDIIEDIIYYFSEKIYSFNEIGLQDIIIDPGFGFGKTLNHNYELLANLDKFGMLDAPILAGISRKSMIYKLLNITPEESLPATSVLHLKALQKNVNILRVHDVKEAKQTLMLYEKLNKFNC
ncbi:MAG: dihydropteroate synthase [Bacteroidota bacterium]|nr:dihydropteroate synthase [Bacteroidota bacterium]